ncbi:YdeI/OmpD-associated family protein [Gemmatimonadota bacterium]
MSSERHAGLRRPLNPMPEWVKAALESQSLMAAFEGRPPYQRNEYLGWVSRAKRPETREKRLLQMLEELRTGDRYIKMPYRAKR